MRAKGVGRSEDRLVEIIEGGFPNTEMEVMNCQQYVIVERGPFQREHRSSVPLSVVLSADILCKLVLTVTTTNRLDAPVYKDEVSLVRSCPESRCGLVGIEEYP